MTVREWVEYVMSFYGNDGLYPIGATDESVINATKILISRLEKDGKEFCGDSVDREFVRDILLSN